MASSSNGPAVEPISSPVDQVALDRKRELDVKEREVAAHEREVAAKEADLKKSAWLRPTVIGLFVAALGLIGSVIVAQVNNSNTQEVARESSEANLQIERFRSPLMRWRPSRSPKTWQQCTPDREIDTLPTQCLLRFGRTFLSNSAKRGP